MTDRGWTNSEDKISLRKGMPKDMETEVLLHEILHCIILIFNLRHKIEQNCEEAIVETISTGLATVFNQNPWLLDKLKRDICRT